MYCDPYANTVEYQGGFSHLLSHTIFWGFHTHIVSLRERIFPFCVYWSFQCGHWPNYNTTPSYSSLPDFNADVLKNGCMTSNDRSLELLILYLQEVQYTCTDTLKTTDQALMQIHNACVILKITPKHIISHIFVAGNMFLTNTETFKVKMRFNEYLGKISMNKSSGVIFLAMGDPREIDLQKIVFNHHWQRGIGFSFFLTHSYSTYFCGIRLLYHSLYLKNNWKEMVVALSVVDVPEEVVVAHAVERAVEVM